jgi:hypothetical protein
MSSDRGSLSEWAQLLVWLLGLGLVIFLILGWAGVFSSGNIDRECYDFQMPNGEMGNSCDQLGEG